LASDVCVGCALIIPLIIQTILLDLSGAVRTDETSNVSRPDRSGADQIDVEHQATDLAVGGSNLSRRAISAAQGLSSKRSSIGRFWRWQSFHLCDCCLLGSHG
jgi:hypothetical protein